MVEQLFGSKTRVKLLRLFMSNPNRSFYVREITRKIDEQINSVRRELSNLLSIGIIVSDSSNNRLYYEVNQKYEHYKPLASIFGGHADDVPAASTASALSDKSKPGDQAATDDIANLKTKPDSEEEKTLGNVSLVVLGGLFTRDDNAPVDLLVVGHPAPAAVNKYISSLEKSTGTEIRYASFTPDEFDYRRQINDKFIITMLGGKLTVKVDKLGIFNTEPESE